VTGVHPQSYGIATSKDPKSVLAARLQQGYTTLGNQRLAVGHAATMAMMRSLMVVLLTVGRDAPPQVGEGPTSR
jgi:hypothetical protein